MNTVTQAFQESSKGGKLQAVGVPIFIDAESIEKVRELLRFEKPMIFGEKETVFLTVELTK